MTAVVEIKNRRTAPRAERSSMETLILTIDEINKWRVPAFQRPLTVNAKLEKLAEELKRDGGVIGGVITLGTLPGDDTLYIVDGQHRLEGFRLSGMREVIADVRIVHFASLAEMSEEYVSLNTALVRMKPDDLLRGLEPTSPGMARIRQKCPFVGYDNIRRREGGPIVGMSALLRCWSASASDTPSGNRGGRTAAAYVTSVDEQEIDSLIRFLHLAFAAWGRDHAYQRLWASLNLTMCMWLYRRLVLDKVRGVKRFVVLNEMQFRQCLMALSADRLYVDWLAGRIMGERDRNACYSHLRRIFAKRLQTEGEPRPLMPQPVWSSR